MANPECYFAMTGDLPVYFCRIESLKKVDSVMHLGHDGLLLNCNHLEMVNDNFKACARGCYMVEKHGLEVCDNCPAGLTQ